jgi:hypothetical protein
MVKNMIKARDMKPHTPETFEHCPVRDQFQSYEEYLAWAEKMLDLFRKIQDRLELLQKQTELEEHTERYKLKRWL